MIAPQPFFEPRGTPFSEFHRIRALTDLGHTVDLVTYPIGQDVTMAGLRVFRSLRVPFLTRVKIGPSLAKIPLDLTKVCQGMLLFYVLACDSLILYRISLVRTRKAAAHGTA